MKKVLCCIPNHEKFILNYMDDLVIFSKSMKEHEEHIQQILTALTNNGLKISPKKSLFYRKRVDYLGHIITIKNGKPYLEIQRSKIDAIKNLKPPTNIKGVRRFCGAVNFLARFLQDLTDLLRPIRKLTRKNVKFRWTEECQTNYDKIKDLLCQAPVLAMPNSSGLIKVYCDTSKTRTGCSIWQLSPNEQEESLIGYFSKGLDPAVQNYSISELELHGIYICLNSLRILKSRYIHVVTDHSALVHMYKSIKEAPTPRLQRLMEKLSRFHFDLFFKKGAEMVLCDFLSRSEVEDDDPTPKVEAIALPVVTRRQAKESGVTVPEVQESKKKLEEIEGKSRTKITRVQEYGEAENENVESNIEPAEVVEEEGLMQPTHIPPTTWQPESVPISAPPSYDTRVTRAIPDVHEQQVTPALNEEFTPYVIDNTLIGKGVTIPLDNTPVPRSTYIPKTKPTPIDMGKLYDTHTPIEEKDLQTNKPLFDTLNKEQIILKNVPKQIDIERFLNQVKQRSLRDFSIPLRIRDIEHEQQRCPWFKDTYVYLKYNTLPSNKRKARNTMMNANHYVLVRDILFKIEENKSGDDFKLLLAVPENSAHYIISRYHDGLFISHMGINKTYNTIKERYFIPGLYNKLSKYIKSCIACEQRKMQNKDCEAYDYIPRIAWGYTPFSELHGDIKYVYDSTDHFKFLLILVDPCTRFTLAFPLKRVNAVNVAEIILQKVILVFGNVERLYFDRGPEFNNRVLLYLTKTLKIDLKFCAEGFHQSNLAERAIKTISELLLSQLKGTGRNWPMYINCLTHSMNVAIHRTIDGFSPYELVFGRKARDMVNIEQVTNLNIPVSYQEYVDSMRDRLQKVATVYTELQNQQQEEQKLQRAKAIQRNPPFLAGDLVYLLYPRATDLQTNTLKFKLNWLGPLVIESVIDMRSVTLTDMEGKIIEGLFSIKRLKRCHWRTNYENVTTMKELKDSIDRWEGEQRQHPEVLKLQPQSLFCLGEGICPQDPCIDKKLSYCNPDDTYTGMTSLKLSDYLDVNGKGNAAITRRRTDRENEVETRLTEDIPREGSINIAKCRYKHGILQIYLQIDKANYGFWMDLNNRSVLPENYRIVSQKGNANRLLLLHESVHEPSPEDWRNSIRITGSLTKFIQNWNGLGDKGRKEGRRD